jgi:hypothetical protein
VWAAHKVNSCPIPGRKVAPKRRIGHPEPMAGAGAVHLDLIDHLARSSALSPGEAARVVEDVLGYFSEPAEEFVRRRHRELKAKGLTNEHAFARIAAELPMHRVTPPHFSPRQLRRIVYG